MFCLQQVSTASTANVKYIIVASDSDFRYSSVRLQNGDYSIEPGP